MIFGLKRIIVVQVWLFYYLTWTSAWRNVIISSWPCSFMPRRILAAKTRKTPEAFVVPCQESQEQEIPDFHNLIPKEDFRKLHCLVSAQQTNKWFFMILCNIRSIKHSKLVQHSSGTIYSLFAFLLATLAVSEKLRRVYWPDTWQKRRMEQSGSPSRHGPRIWSTSPAGDKDQPIVPS